MTETLLPAGPTAGPTADPTAGPTADSTGGGAADRPLWPALLRGWRGRCPACGAGPILRGYLTVRDSCPACGQALHHHRADDGPAYLTILVVGHVMAPVLLFAFIRWRPDPLLLAAVFTVGTVALSLWLLPRLKGALVGVQWSRRMHGFGRGGDAAHD